MSNKPGRLMGSPSATLAATAERPLNSRRSRPQMPHFGPLWAPQPPNFPVLATPNFLSFEVQFAPSLLQLQFRWRRPHLSSSLSDILQPRPITTRLSRLLHHLLLLSLLLCFARPLGLLLLRPIVRSFPYR